MGWVHEWALMIEEKIAGSSELKLEDVSVESKSRVNFPKTEVQQLRAIQE
jgi:hypothetical protein